MTSGDRGAEIQSTGLLIKQLAETISQIDENDLSELAKMHGWCQALADACSADDVIRQCRSHSVAGSSRYGSKPSSERRHSPNLDGCNSARRTPRLFGSSSRIPATKHQCRIERTMFFPTPNSVIAASSSQKTRPLGSLGMAT